MTARPTKPKRRPRQRHLCDTKGCEPGCQTPRLKGARPTPTAKPNRSTAKERAVVVWHAFPYPSPKLRDAIEAAIAEAEAAVWEEAAERARVEAGLWPDEKARPLLVFAGDCGARASAAREPQPKEGR